MTDLIKNGAIILALFTASLYTIGTSYWNGIYKYFNIPGDIFVRDFNTSLYEGLVVFGNNFSLAMILGIVLYLIFAIMVTCFNKTRVKSYFEKFDMIRGLEKHLGREYLFQLIIGAAVIMILFGVHKTLLYFQDSGERNAKEMIQEIKDGNVESIRNVLMSHNGITKKIYLIKCDSKICAGVDKSTSSVFYFPATDIEKSDF